MVNVSNGAGNDRRGAALLLAGMIGSAFACLVITGCPERTMEGTAEAPAPMINGQVDATHEAVVNLLSANGKQQCTGTIVQVKNGFAYVLTAGHCCKGAPRLKFVNPSSSDVFPAFGLSPIIGKPVVDPCIREDVPQSFAFGIKVPEHDFCMLRFEADPNITPFIPVATGADGLGSSSTVTVDELGFGKTTPDAGSGSMVRKRTTADVLPGDVTKNVFVTHSNGGILCGGDSGGPALRPAGAPPGSQKVVGVISATDDACVAPGSFFSRVTSATGPGGFITDYLNGKTQKKCLCRSRQGGALVAGAAAPDICCLDGSQPCGDGQCCAGACGSDGTCCSPPAEVVDGVCCPAGTVEACSNGSCCTGECADNGTCCAPPTVVVDGVCCPSGSTSVCNGICCNGACAADGTCCAAPNEVLQCGSLSICTPPNQLQCLSCPNINGSVFPQPVPVGYTCCGNVYNGNNVCAPDAGCQLCPNSNTPGEVNGECFSPGQNPGPCAM
jgi:hypothetical protein